MSLKSDFGEKSGEGKKESGGFKDVLLFQIVKTTDVVISQTPHTKRKGIISDVERKGGEKERTERGEGLMM